LQIPVFSRLTIFRYKYLCVSPCDLFTLRSLVCLPLVLVIHVLGPFFLY
jgi:hypothetical protein